MEISLRDTFPTLQPTYRHTPTGGVAVTNRQVHNTQYTKGNGVITQLTGSGVNNGDKDVAGTGAVQETAGNQKNDIDDDQETNRLPPDISISRFVAAAAYPLTVMTQANRLAAAVINITDAVCFTESFMISMKTFRLIL